MYNSICLICGNDIDSNCDNFTEVEEDGGAIHVECINSPEIDTIMNNLLTGGK